MASLVASVAFDMEAFWTDGSLAEFFEFGEVVAATDSSYILAYADETTSEQLALTGSFADYVDGVPGTGTITELAYTLDGNLLFTLSGLALSVEDFTAYVNSDDLPGLFAQLLAGADEITGSSGNDALQGLAGNDVLYGLTGDDILDGGDGHDILRGGEGNDQLSGGEGDDFLSESSGDFGPFGNDVYDGGAGNDRVSLFTAFGPGVTVDLRVATAQNTGSMGTDTFIGIEHITANYGDDTLIGNDAGNWFWTFNGTDTLTGNGGDDMFTVGLGTKVIDGGTGADTVEIIDLAFEPLYTADGVAVSLLQQGQAQETGIGAFTLTSIENLSGFYGSDEFTGDDNANILAGEGGDDTLIGNGGDDILAGDGTFGLSEGDAGAITFIPQADGATGNDHLDGGAGNDTLIGGTGDDTLIGGAGDDTLDGGEGRDLVSYANAASSVTVSLATAGAQNTGGDGVDNLVSIEGLLGSDHDDQLTGDDNDNVLAGGAGADTLDGGGGNDTLYSDVLSPFWERPFFNNNPEFVAPVLDTGTEVDTLNGGAGLDTIYAGYGDIVDGGTDRANLLISLMGATSGVTADFRDLDDGGTLTIGGNTISNIQSVLWIEGSNHDDIITGSDQHQGFGSEYAPIFGRGGNDQLTAGVNTGNIYGGDGNDTIESEHSGGYLYGDAGDDTINFTAFFGFGTMFGGDGNDTLNITGGGASGGAGNDVITASFNGNFGLTAEGNDGDDTLNGDQHGDSLYGGSGADVLNGNGANDTLYSAGDDGYTWDGIRIEQDGGAEHDQLSGGDGDDRLSIGYGDDADGGTGTNTLALSLIGASSGVTLNVADLTSGAYALGGGTIQNIQQVTHLWGSNFADTLTLSGSIVAYGMGGNDTIHGTALVDHIHGGAGADTINAGDGDDFIYVDDLGEVAAGEQINGGNGNDTLVAVGHPGLPDDSYYDISGATLTGIERLESVGPAEIGLTGAQLAGISTLAASLYFTSGGAVSLDGITAESFVSLRLNEAGNQLDLRGFTPSSFLIVRGSDSADTVYGSASSDNVYAEGGADVLYGYAGSDDLRGGDGNDIIDGGAGQDWMNGGRGNDIYYVDSTLDSASENNDDPDEAGDGIDQVFASATFTLGAGLENLTLTGTAAINANGNELANILHGNEGANWLSDVGGDDRLYGFGGNDRLYGGAGADKLYGGTGDDTYIVDDGDLMIELAGEGTDFVRAIVSHTLKANFENLTLIGTAATNGTGNELDNVLTGNANTNQLYGLDGNDTLNGGAGADQMTGGAGNDTYIVDNVGDLAIEVASTHGTADLVRSSVSYTLGAKIENLTLTGAAAIDGTGNAGANTLIGNSAANLLNGAAGADVMQGGAGDDIYVVDHAGDQTIELAGEGSDLVRSSLNHTLAANVENLTLTGTASSGTGNAEANILIGNAAANTLNGGAGADQMIGGAGNDAYLVDDAGDQAIEIASTHGTDQVLSSVSYALGAKIENLTLIGAGTINGTGNAGANILIGNDAANVLNGGSGADWMQGLGGNDTYIVDNVGDQVSEAAFEGSDMVQSSLSHTLAANVENLTLTGTAEIYGEGNADANILIGNSAANQLNGSFGADQMTGGAGNDTYFVDDAGDVAIELASTHGTDQVLSSVSYVLGAKIENLDLTGFGAINGTGNAGANVINGNSAANSLSGLGGADTFDGGAGQDICTGGSGADTFLFQDGDFAGLTTSTCDAITDFSQAGGDLIDLSLVDGNTNLAGDHALAFIGGAAFGGTAGELRYEQIDGNTYLQGDTDGDSIADFLIRLDGLHTVQAADLLI
jgi:Ca2+-binding RTX toxin-like protein